MPPVLKWVLVGAVVAAAILGLDRLLLAAEARGFIYYRRRKASPGSLGSAMLEIHSLMQPSARHAVEEQRRVVEEEDDAGAPPPNHTGVPSRPPAQGCTPTQPSRGARPRPRPGSES